MAYEERLEMMCKRYALISRLVFNHSTLEDFAYKNTEWFALFGVVLELRKDCVSLHFELGNGDYEEYYVVVSSESSLAVSNIICWQNEVCANELLNIFTGQTCDNEDIILSTY